MITWRNRGTHTHTQLHLDMATERVTSHTQGNWFAREWTVRTAQSLLTELPRSPAALWPASSTTSRVRCAKPMATTSTVVPAALLLALCGFTLLRENDCPPSCMVWQQQTGAAGPCPASSLLSSFGTVGTGGILVSSKHMNLTEKLVKTVGAFGRP